MKSIAVLLVVIALVAGLAVNGSRAQPLPETSTAFRLCQLGQTLPQPCRPLISPEQARVDVERESAADAGGDGGDKHIYDLGVRVALAVSRAVAEWWASHYSGRLAADVQPVDWEIFDATQ